MKKILINDQEFLILEKPIKILNQLYGATNHLVKLMRIRFEMFDFNILPQSQLVFFFEQICHFIPISMGFKNLILYNLFYLDCANTYQMYRHLFNLPVNGQRT